MSLKVLHENDEDPLRGEHPQTFKTDSLAFQEM